MRSLSFFFLIILASVLEVSAQSAEQIMDRARIAATLQNHDLHGTIRGGSNRGKTPIHLFLRGENIQFTTHNGARRFHMRLKDDHYDLLEIVDGKDRLFDSAKLRERVAGSDLTYEDLSMRFFYWPDAQLLGEERVGTHMCWKIRLNNPKRDGNYGVMYAWMHQKYGAFMKIEGFDRKGKRIKRFLVEDVMKLPDDTYTLAKMRVSSMDGEKTLSHSYLEFEKPTRAIPKGPR
ncbi:MAG: outer membrane lipoprotein-sorting protein [Verrucomicrobiales bacterium]